MFFSKADENLSKLVRDKTVKDIKHTDKEACIQITFSDKSYIVVEAMPAKRARSGAIPLFHYYDVDGQVILYDEFI